MDSSAININKKDQDDSAPTPQNTPIFTAPIGSNSSENANISQMLGNPALTNLIQGRLDNLAGASSGYIQTLPKTVQRRLAALQFLQSKHTELEAKFHQEILDIEKKYALLYKPLFDKRHNIISGKEEAAEDDIKAGEAIIKELDGDDELDSDEKQEQEKESSTDVLDSDESEIKGIDSFWLTALYNHPQTREMITERDSKALESLVDVSISYLESGPGFQINFDFRENPYFSNNVLTKTYYYQQSSTSGEMVFGHSEGCKIEWKPEMDLTMTVETKKQRHKTTNKTRVIKKAVPAESFFNLFEDIPVPEDSDDSEEAEEARERLEADYELGEELKEKINLSRSAKESDPPQCKQQ
ncbi:hypothetical protein BB561_002298 [Smittium simulii]|uniref:Nucleosome assembly protein n=1 Tax=Smittium simulii TaxID=133385 RepID=A0A2T9YQV8_9FUNG|nr:hypothetical protein BB561_002298 [Smittium simulii]